MKSLPKVPRFYVSTKAEIPKRCYYPSGEIIWTSRDEDSNRFIGKVHDDA